MMKWHGRVMQDHHRGRGGTCPPNTRFSTALITTTIAINQVTALDSGPESDIPAPTTTGVIPCATQ
jgi:hypothetical protein